MNGLQGLGPQRQRGAALLLAMLVVTLVASLSAAAFWEQWRGWQVESADQQQGQTAWLLTGALDWARLILREDARASTADHLAEPWAVPLQEARLSAFLAVPDDGHGDSVPDAVLSGEVTDQQGKINLRNLLENGDKAQISEDDRIVCQRLFDAVGVPSNEQALLLRQLTALEAKDGTGQPRPEAPLLPDRFEQLSWLGLSSDSLRALAPHATWLPERTPLNVNTASALALYASVPGLDLTQANRIVQQRSRQHFKTLDDVRLAIPGAARLWSDERHGTSSRFFLVRGLLRLDGLTTEETSLVVRHGQVVNTLWRQRGGLGTPQPAGPAGADGRPMSLKPI